MIKKHTLKTENLDYVIGLEKQKITDVRTQFKELYNFKNINFTFKQLCLELNYFFAINNSKSRKDSTVLKNDIYLILDNIVLSNSLKHKLINTIF